MSPGTGKIEDAGKGKRREALGQALAQIEKAYGKGSIMRLGESTRADVPAIPTGSIGLDHALGIGGFPRGRIIEVFGPEMSGKTTLALHAVANAQKAGGVAAYIDAEHAVDATYAGNMGVDVDNLLISQPDTGEQALDIVELLVRSNSVDIIVVDSVAALTPRAEIEGNMGDEQIGLQARLMSKAMRKLAGAIGKSMTCVIFINQIRMKIGVMFGNPETTPGGRALKFYSSVRIDIRRLTSIREKNEIVGNRTQVRVVKNKLAPPFKKTEFDIIYGQGISRAGELIDIGIQAGEVKKSGVWFSCDGQRIGQGRENAKQFLEENRAVADGLETKLREFLKNGDAAVKQKRENKSSAGE